MNIWGIIAVLVLAVLVVGCATTQQEKTGDSTQKTDDSAGTTPTQSTKLSMGNLYRYDKAGAYEYKVTVNAGGQQTSMNIKYSTKADSVDGKAAWLSTSETTTNGVSVMTQMWLDKMNNNCLKILTKMDVAEQKIEQPTACPQEGPNSATVGSAPELDLVGTESVTVPAGTFSADKYTVSGVTFWINSNVPVPIKIETDATITELVSYSS